MIPLNIDFENDYESFFAKSVIDYVKRKGTKYTISKLNRVFKKEFEHFGINSFYDIILAKPDKLDELISLYNTWDTSKQSDFKNEAGVIVLYNNFNKGDFQEYTGFKYYKLNSELHFNQMKIENCPYCNENKTTQFEVVEPKTGESKLKRIYDWDHFYPKTHYPFFAISLYNLVPSCKTCNFLKKNSIENCLNPHEKYSIDDYLTFSFDLDNIDYYLTADSFKIQKQTSGLKKKQTDNLLEAISLLERYQANKEMIRFNLLKYRDMETDLDKLKEYGLSEDSDDLLGKYFGVYTSPENYSKMPYSKLLSDIFIRKS